MRLQAVQGIETPREGRFLLLVSTPLAVLAAAALAAGWIAPNHYPPWTGFHGEAAAFAALLLFCVARLCRPEPLVVPRASLAVLALVPIIALQWWSQQIAYGGDAILSVLYLIGFALAWSLGASTIELPELRGVRWLAVVVIFVAAASVLIATLQWLRMEQAIGIYAAERGPSMRAFGNFAQPNHLASLILMGVVLAGALYAEGVLKSWHVAVLVFWLSFGLTLTESRSGQLGALVVGTFAVAKRREAGRLGNWRPVAAWWLLLTVLALLWQPVNEALYLEPGRDTPLGGDNGRFTMWRQVIAGIEQSPWLGYGWRQTIVSQRAGAMSVSGWLATDYAHNVVLDVLAWLGVPLAAALLAACGWWLARAAKRVCGLTQLTLFAATLPLLVHSFFEFPFAYSYFLFPAGWMLGALDREQQHTPPTPKDLRIWVAAAAVVLAWGAVCAAVAREYLLLEEDYRVMRFELRRVGVRPPGYEAPTIHLLTQLDALVKAGRIVARPGMPPAQVEALRVAAGHYGWATLDLGYAVALALNGQPGLASAELRLARNLYGEHTYADLCRIFYEVADQYPELKAVQVP